MFTVDIGCVLLALPSTFGDAAGMTRNFTSGGIDNGARPIRDGHFLLEENERAGVEDCKAGSRNEGIVSNGEHCAR